jgi:hypothetical protein
MEIRNRIIANMMIPGADQRNFENFLLIFFFLTSISLLEVEQG